MNHIPKFKFEKLRVWQEAMKYGERVHKLTKNFPIDERFNLKSQLCRAVDSIALNLSEGSIGQSNPEQRRFIGYAIRSNSETVTCLIKAKQRTYIENSDFNELYNEAYDLQVLLIAFRNSLS